MSIASKKYTGACLALTKEYQSIMTEPIEGFTVMLVDDSDIFEWEAGMFGPPQTPFEGGYFRVRIRFPTDYPFSPPVIRFVDEMCHPNIYKNGLLCISILHAPTDTEAFGELPCERWNPTQNVRTIMLSAVSLLNDPNIFSPANPDAAELYRRWCDTNGRDKSYLTVVRRLAIESNARALRLGIVVPKTVEEYCLKPLKSNPEKLDDPDKGNKTKNSNSNNGNLSLPSTNDK